MLAGRAGVDNAGVLQFAFQSGQLRVGFPAHRSIDKSNLAGLQLRVEQLQQVASSHGVDQHCPIPHGSPFETTAISVPGDLHPDDPRTSHLVQRFSIRRIVAEIRDDQAVAVVVAVDLCQFTGSAAAVQVLRQFVELENPGDRGLEWAVTADHRSRSITAASHIVSDDSG